MLQTDKNSNDNFSNYGCIYVCRPKKNTLYHLITAINYRLFYNQIEVRFWLRDFFLFTCLYAQQQNVISMSFLIAFLNLELVYYLFIST